MTGLLLPDQRRDPAGAVPVMLLFSKSRGAAPEAGGGGPFASPDGSLVVGLKDSDGCDLHRLQGIFGIGISSDGEKAPREHC